MTPDQPDMGVLFFGILAGMLYGIVAGAWITWIAISDADKREPRR